jgi:predicted aspartyl protease
MIYSFDYDTTYEPAIPLGEVNIRKVGQDINIHVPAIIDSGADGSLIPMQIIQQINSVQSGWVRIKNLDSVSRRIPVYLVQISIQASEYISAPPAAVF